MLDLHCTSCRRHVLVGTRAIEGWHEDADGIRIDVRCACGALNLVRTGRGGPDDIGETAPRHRREAPAGTRTAHRARAA